MSTEATQTPPANRPLAIDLTSGVLASVKRWAGGDVLGWTAAVVVFSLAAIVQTWPLVLHAGNRVMDVPDQPGDTGYYLWNLWWIKDALLELQNPYHTDLIYYPQGADLYLGGLLFISGVLSIPLQLATGNLILSANLLGVAFFVLSGLSMYALALHVTHNRLAALLSGFIFAFAPFTVIRFQGGEWNHSATWVIPLFALFLLRLQETGRLREAVAAGICWAVIIYNWLEFGTDAALLLALFATYWSFTLVRKRDWQHLRTLWRGLAVIAVVTFALTSPLMIQALRSVYSGSYPLVGGDEFYSADLLAYFTRSPLWGEGRLPGTPYGEHLPIGSIENTAYLGFVPLILAGIALLGVLRRPHQVVFWAIVFLTFAILALGPYLYVDGDKTHRLFGLSLTVPLPYQLYDELPVVSSRRIPARMVIFGILGLSVLAAIGLDLLTSWLRPKLGAAVLVVTALISGLVALEYWNPPVHLSEVPRAAIFDTIRQEPGDFTVLDAPLGRQDGYFVGGDSSGGWLATYHQWMHEKPVIGGYVNRATDLGWIMEQPGLHYIACHCVDPEFQGDTDSELVRSVFREHKIGYVVLHKQDPFGRGLFFFGESEITAMDSYLREVVGLRPVYSDSKLTVYRNRDVG
jgi:hypothetical protein